jgi:hypothetical protein
MGTGVIVGSAAPEVDRNVSRETLEALLDRGEMEIVTTPSGEILYIRQSVED